MVKIFPKGAVQTKNAILVGPLGFQMLFTPPFEFCLEGGQQSLSVPLPLTVLVKLSPRNPILIPIPDLQHKFKA